LKAFFDITLLFPLPCPEVHNSNRSPGVTHFLIDHFGETHKAKSEQLQLKLQAEHLQAFRF